MRDRMWDMADLLEGECDRMGVKPENLGNARIIVIYTAYLKAHYPEDYLEVLISSDDTSI